MEEKLQEIWNSVGNKIRQIVNEKQNDVVKMGIKPNVTDAMCAEGGFMVGYYPEKGFDIRAYGWTPSSVRNNPKWYKSIHWGTAMGDSNSKELITFANELSKESQKIWDEGIKSL